MVDNLNEEVGMNSELTKFLMNNQYKSKYTLWIIEELIEEDEELYNAIFNRTDWLVVYTRTLKRPKKERTKDVFNNRHIPLCVPTYKLLFL